MIRFEAKDLVSLVVVVGLFILIALDKVSWQAAAPIISAIVFYYLGVKTGLRMARREGGKHE